MTLSRMALLMLAAAQSPSLSAEQMMARHQAGSAVAGTGCASEAQTDEIVVCGRKSRDFRLPLPTEPVPGSRSADAAPVQLEGLRRENCAPTVHSGCGGMVPMIPIIMGAVKAAEKIVGEVVDPE